MHDPFAKASRLSDTSLGAKTSSSSTMSSMNDNTVDRRTFLKQASVASLGLGVAGYFGSLGRANAQATPSPAKKFGANDKITAAICGTNGRGLTHVHCLTNIPGVEVKYICDVDTRAMAKGVKETAKKQ